MDKIYYEFKMKAKSPLRIGGGGNEETDSDLLLDGRGFPFIPGSSLAGVLRSLLDSEDEKRLLFGDVIIATDLTTADSFPSKVLVGDGVLSDDFPLGDMLISKRDGVGIDNWGMTIKSEKFDFQIAEVKGTFKSIIECNFDTKEQLTTFERIISHVVAEGLRLGARTTRGYGKFECDIKRRIFKIPEDVEGWLEFNAYSKDAFKRDKADTVSIGQENLLDTVIKIDLIINGNLTIRVKEANTVVREDGTNPDDVTLKNHEGAPVIPGTSWAGTFRHHMLKLIKEIHDFNLTEKEVNRLFGKGVSSDDSTKSFVRFSESVIEGGIPVVTMRNSVDRFTAAPTNGSLFTTESWNGGKTTLIIDYSKDKLIKQSKQLLSLAIIDLHMGLMTVGGGAGIGKGIVSIEKITVNGEDKTDDLTCYRLKV